MATRTVTVPTEDGRKAVIDFERDEKWPNTWTVRIADELIAMAPQAIHAAVGQALMQMREEQS